MSIKVLNDKLWDGKKYLVVGDIVNHLSEDTEDELVEAGKAEYVFEPEKDNKIPPVKLIPDGNVEKVKEFISGIEDVELLQKMADEEAADKNRKTVLEAIYERAQELDDSEDDEESDENEDEDEDPNINLNPEDVIVNG